MSSGCARILLVGSGRDGEEAKPVNTIVSAVTVLDSDTLELAVGTAAVGSGFACAAHDPSL
jgi:hypothetical protein